MLKPTVDSTVASREVVDLCGIEPDYCEGITKLDPILEEQYHLRNLYFKESNKTDTEFERWLENVNLKLVKDVHDFIISSSETNKSTFKPTQELIYPATIILGMQTSDHAATIDLLAKQTRKQFPKLQLLRLKADVRKKSLLMDMLDQIDHDKVIVIVEKADNLSSPLLEGLISRLHRSITNRIAKKIILLLCVSSKFKLLRSYIGRDPMTLMKSMEYIAKTREDSLAIIDDVRQRLLQCQMCPIRLGPKVVDLFSTEFIERDASITKLKYVFQYMLFDKLHAGESILLLSKSELTDALNPSLISTILGLKSMQKHKTSLSKVSAKQLANFCWEKIRDLKEYHDYIIGQIQYFFTMLRDETYEGFPCNSTDIYEELLTHDDLGHSVLFVDAINKLTAYPIERILERIDQCTSVYKGLPESVNLDDYGSLPTCLKDGQDLYLILNQFKCKLENNDNSKEIVKELINRLLKHAITIQNPLMKPLGEVLYVVHSEPIRQRTLPSTRSDFKCSMMKGNTFFDILYRVIDESPEAVSMTDLYLDFQQAVELQAKPKRARYSIEVPKSKLSRSSGKTPRQINKIVPTRTSHLDNKENSSGAMIDGLLEALFLDLLDSMERLGVIKHDTRRSSRGMLIKCIWL